MEKLRFTEVKKANQEGIKPTVEKALDRLAMAQKLYPQVILETVANGNLSRQIDLAYEEIQKSPNYASGYALRFPRFIRLRPDKGPNEADDIERIEKIYLMQKGERATEEK